MEMQFNSQGQNFVILNTTVWCITSIIIIIIIIIIIQLSRIKLYDDVWFRTNFERTILIRSSRTSWDWSIAGSLCTEVTTRQNENSEWELAHR